MAERGIKRKCASCGTSYYDLNRKPITCPKCGAAYEAAMPTRPPRGRMPATPPPRPVEIDEEVAEEAEAGEEEFEEADDLPSDDEGFVAPEEDEDRD